MFELERDFNVVATGSTAYDAMAIFKTHLPDILVLDLSLPGDAFEVITAISTLSLNSKVVVFTASTSIQIAIQALQAGARGYLVKGTSADEVLRGIRAVQEGSIYITQDFASKVIGAFSSASNRRMVAPQIRFNHREGQIIRLLERGHTNKEIAVSLGISYKTVKHYMTVLMQKLNARNRLEAMLAAQKLAAESGSDPLKAVVH